MLPTGPIGEHRLEIGSHLTQRLVAGVFGLLHLTAALGEGLLSEPSLGCNLSLLPAPLCVDCGLVFLCRVLLANPVQALQLQAQSLGQALVALQLLIELDASTALLGCEAIINGRRCLLRLGRRA